MQKINTLIAILICNLSLVASTPPEHIEPLTQSIYPIEYYIAQMTIWEDHIHTHQEDASAWLNYYTAARNANVLSASQLNNLEVIATNSSKYVPNTFETHFIQYRQSGLFERKYEDLLKAHALAPDRWEAYHELLYYYKMKGDQAAINTYAQLIYESGHLSSGILDWNYNALMSVSDNGILLTQSDNDTYPVWVLQQVKHIREDINVINLYLLLAENVYREQVFSQLNIKRPFNRLKNQHIDSQLNDLIDHLFTYSSRPLFLGVATPANLRKHLSNDLYLTGLAFQHSKQQIDNLAILDYNYQKQFRTESLSASLVYDPSETVVNHMNMNYIPSFALLYRYYTDNNRDREAEQTKILITKIATRANKLSVVDVIFTPQTREEKRTETSINLREVDKRLMMLNGNIYATATEVSNAEYNAFLEDLLQKRKYQLLEKCQIYPTDWRSFLPQEYLNLDEAVIFRHGHPDNENHPIVNISYEAAQIYCEWLTEVYNQSEHRKKRFSKVHFRLPTNEEWTLAAKAKRENNVYPWGGPYYSNAKGCLLANFDPSHEMTEESTEPTGIPADDDGAYFTVTVDAYFPNNTGFYNMAGNVAEMTDQENITRGGGWNDPAYYMQTDVQNKETIPSPNVGFRVFMEVIKD